MDRRGFLATSLGGVTIGAIAISGAATKFQPETLFLTYSDDPLRTVCVQWIGSAADLQHGHLYFSAKGESIWKVKPITARPFPLTDLLVFRCELTGLTPGTEYQFAISNSPTYRFRTMPAKATNSFHFVTGGDCGVNSHAMANNLLAARQDPYFAVIGGDLGYDNGKSAKIAYDFIKQYSAGMIDTQGRMIPLVVCIGNHEVAGGYGKTRKDAPFFFALFDGLFDDASYATLDFGDYLSLVLLDTGHCAPIKGEQTHWLEKNLYARVEMPHLFIVNHVPAYPSHRLATVANSKTGTGTGEDNRKHWSPLFEKYNVDVVLEHHDHTFKRTHPMLGGLRDDRRGILYLGDGSWGRLRAPTKPESRPYMALMHEAYHFTQHRIEGENRFHLAMDEFGKVVDICLTTKKTRTKTS
ncbi:MAG: purple acid phosphatase family protein [Gemmataceae bacterium]